MSPMKKLPFSTLRRIPLGSIRGSENSYRKKKKEKNCEKNGKTRDKKNVWSEGIRWLAVFIFIERKRLERALACARAACTIPQTALHLYIHIYTWYIYRYIYSLHSYGVLYVYNAHGHKDKQLTADPSSCGVDPYLWFIC